MPTSSARHSDDDAVFTINEFAAMHRVSRSVVRKWIEQGRVKHERRGGGTARAAAVLIFQRDRPPREEPGALSPEQRKAWKKK